MSDCGNVKKVFVPVKEEAKNERQNSLLPKGIGMTDTASEKIKHFCQVDNKSPEEYGLKVTVVKDGCSGNSYIMDLARVDDAKAAGDKVFEKNGAILIVDKLSYMFVLGSELDYVETLLMSGFQLVNPNVKRTCSCGSSFSVK